MADMAMDSSSDFRCGNRRERRHWLSLVSADSDGANRIHHINRERLGEGGWR